VSVVLSTDGGKGVPTREPNHHAEGVNILFKFNQNLVLVGISLILNLRRQYKYAHACMFNRQDTIVGRFVNRWMEGVVVARTNGANILLKFNPKSCFGWHFINSQS
jgi:hypothetical protein